MDQAMHDQFPWRMLALLAALKIVATTLSFITGTPGGMFAPTLFIGAMLGGAVGGAERILVPHLTGSTATYALVGMGVLFAGFLRAPMTSVFMVLEVSGNYGIIVPVMVANTLAYLISRSLQSVAIFDILTRQDGLLLPSLEEQREEAVLTIEDAMQPPPGVILDSGLSVAQSLERARNSTDSLLLVRVFPSGWAGIRREGLELMIKEGKGDLSLGSVVESRRLPSLYPDLPLEAAWRFVNTIAVVPVVSRADQNKLEGIVTEKCVLERYQARTEAAH